MPEQTPKKPFLYLNLKDTDGCYNLNCDCGEITHIDGFYTFEIECDGCGKVFEIGHILPIKEKRDA